MGRLIFVIDQNIDYIIIFFWGGHFKCGHPRALHCVNPGLGMVGGYTGKGNE